MKFGNRKYPAILAPIVSLAILAAAGLYGPGVQAQAPAIDTSGEPIQSACDARDFTLRTRNGVFTLTTKASYVIAALVVSRRAYNDGWNAELSPVDLALAWGRLAEPGWERYISYSQSGRWYHYRYTAGCPYTQGYIITHSANNHIIPATENLRLAIMLIRAKESVILEGYLVYIQGSYKGKSCWWRSSLTRTDSGNGSCEVFYVTRVTMRGYIYE